MVDHKSSAGGVIKRAADRLDVQDSNAHRVDDGPDPADASNGGPLNQQGGLPMADESGTAARLTKLEAQADRLEAALEALLAASRSDRDDARDRPGA